MNEKCPKCGQADCFERAFTDDDIRQERIMVTKCNACGHKTNYTTFTYKGMIEMRSRAYKEAKRGAINAWNTRMEE